MNDRTKRYEGYGISRDRYMELKFIARQYDAMIAAEKRLRNGETDRKGGRSGKWKQTDPTGNAAVDIACRSLAPRIRAIEDSARAACGEDALWKYIMRCVTRGETWEMMAPPCGRRQFYAMRRRFFIELDARV